jgi:integrase
MSAAATAPISPEVAIEPGRRDWFLRDSQWSDSTWRFAPTSILEEERPVRLSWDFALPSGRRFTEPAFAGLLESARRLIEIVRTRSLGAGVAQRAVTARIYFNHLRTLLRWMDAAGFTRFDALDAAAIADFQQEAAARTRHDGKRITPTTLALHLRMFTYLRRHRALIGDGLSFDPWPGRGTHAAAGVHSYQRGSRAYTPDDIAVPLVQGAIELLSACTIDVLNARATYAAATTEIRPQTRRTKTRYRRAAKRLRARPLDTPLGVYSFRTLEEFYDLVDMLYAACFVVISYLVGARVSEILHLQIGCIQPLAGDNAAGVAVLVGTIFKFEAGYHGRSHQWVVPDPVVHAVAVLEALSAPHRLRSGRPDLWLRTKAGYRAVTEWESECVEPLWIPSTTRINEWLTRFARRLSLPAHEGQCWRLSTHQGRKTFARFIALRDRTSLFALAQHLGHRDRAITDTGYVGTDYSLQREIEAEVLEQSVGAWEHMLSAPQLGGRAGAELVAKRPHFCGRSIKQDLKSYARLLVEAGLTLGVCDWGFCVYREEYSACRGDAFGPNPERREPSTCARCKNFVVSGHHRSYWLDQADRHEALLRDPALPTQTLRIARERLTEALSMIHAIDGSIPT